MDGMRREGGGREEGGMVEWLKDIGWEGGGSVFSTFFCFT